MNTKSRIAELTQPGCIGLFLQACSGLVTAAITLRRHALPIALAGLCRERSRRTTDVPPAETIEKARRLQRYLNFLLTEVVRTTRPCLLRTLALLAYCRQRGVPVRFHIGVRPDGGSMVSHSWLSLGGNLFLEKPTALLGLEVVYCYPESIEPSPDLEGFAKEAGRVVPAA